MTGLESHCCRDSPWARLKRKINIASRYVTGAKGAKKASMVLTISDSHEAARVQ